MQRVIFLFLVVLAISIPVCSQEQAAQPPAADAQQTSPYGFTYIPVPISVSDMRCAGFITKEAVSHKNVVSGGLYFPDESQFATKTVFISGEGLQPGARYSVLRDLRDPNHFEPFKGQLKDIAEAGQPYADLGTIRVTAIRGKSAIAEIELACQNMTVGDLVVPYQERQPVTTKKSSPFNIFPSAAGNLNGRIIMAKEFDTILRTGNKVYLNVGADKGVKLGDYFTAFRSYDPSKLNEIDNLSYPAPVGEDTQKHPGLINEAGAKDLPERATGEMVVIYVTPSSSTAMITYAIEDIQVGDRVGRENEPPEGAPTAAPGQ
jgi:hypothetical protein